MSEQKSVEQQTPPEQAGITLNDIANVVRIIDVASQRGAFRGPELSQVGTVHDRLMKFLEANQPNQQKMVNQKHLMMNQKVMM